VEQEAQPAARQAQAGIRHGGPSDGFRDKVMHASVGVIGRVIIGNEEDLSTWQRGTVDHHMKRFNHIFDTHEVCPAMFEQVIAPLGAERMPADAVDQVPEIRSAFPNHGGWTQDDEFDFWSELVNQHLFNAEFDGLVLTTGLWGRAFIDPSRVTKSGHDGCAAMHDTPDGDRVGGVNEISGDFKIEGGLFVGVRKVDQDAAGSEVWSQGVFVDEIGCHDNHPRMWLGGNGLMSDSHNVRPGILAQAREEVLSKKTGGTGDHHR